MTTTRAIQWIDIDSNSTRGFVGDLHVGTLTYNLEGAYGYWEASALKIHDGRFVMTEIPATGLFRHGRENIVNTLDETFRDFGIRFA